MSDFDFSCSHGFKFDCKLPTHRGCKSVNKKQGRKKSTQTKPAQNQQNTPAQIQTVFRSSTLRNFAALNIGQQPLVIQNDLQLDSFAGITSLIGTPTLATEEELNMAMEPTDGGAGMEEGAATGAGGGAADYNALAKLIRGENFSFTEATVEEKTASDKIKSLNA